MTQEQLILLLQKEQLKHQIDFMRTCVEAYESGNMNMEIMMAMFKFSIDKGEKELLQLETQLIAANES